MNWIDTCAIGVAGAAGGVARYVVDGVARSRFGQRFPFGTLSINVSGSLLLGVLSGLGLFHHETSAWISIIGIGFCGAFTTFSAASFETVRLIQQRRFLAALLNGGGSLVLCIGAAAIGVAAGGL